MDNNILVQIKDAIDHIDRPLANRLLRKMKSGEISDPEAVKYRKNLQIVNFPDLSDDEMAAVMKERIIDFFRLQIPLEDSLEARYLAVGTIEKNVQREKIKKAILQNTEKIGAYTIGQWLRLFDQAYNPDDRGDEEIMAFATSNPEFAKLTPPAQSAVKQIIHAYDTLISSQLVDIYDLVDVERRFESGYVPSRMAAAPEAPYASYREGYAAPASAAPFSLDRMTPVERAPQPAPARPVAEPQITQLPFKRAVQKYPELNNQLISSHSIQPEGAPNPMQPTVRNWIRDYYDIMGTEKHSTIERSKYFYNSPNARMLSQVERQHLVDLIRSLEDETPLSIDAANKRIIFEEAALQKQPSSATPAPSIRTAPAPREHPAQPQQPEYTEIRRPSSSGFELSSSFHDNPANVSSMKFGAPHRLPNEKI